MGTIGGRGTRRGRRLPVPVLRSPSRVVGVGLPLLVGLLHVALVAPHYFVGSFDDDAGYILAAKGLLAGTGLTGTLPSGDTVIGLYPPGYSALLAPLLWLWPHSFVPLRLLSVLCYAAAFPLTWIWLRRRGLTPLSAGAALLVLALGPPFATYGSMVMAEAPFLVVVLLLLLSVDRWGEQARAATGAGVAVVVLAAATVWLKQAGIGLVIGLLLWLPFSRSSRRWRKAAMLAAALIVALLPVVIVRLSAGIPLAGARYSQELGGYYQGGLLKRLVDVVPGSTWHLLSTAIPATLVPYLEPLPIAGAWARFWIVVSWQVTLLAGIGAIVWARRHRDAVLPMTLVYLGECVLWPFVNERRAILVLPVLVAWYVTGGRWVWAQVEGRVRTAAAARWWRTGAVLLALGLVVAPLVVQLPRDYLYGWNQSGSHFGGSRYAGILSAVGRPSDVVETDYRQSTALFTGHVTRWDAFVYNQVGYCSLPAVLSDLRSDDADFLLLGDLNKPGQIDNACLDFLAPIDGWAVPLLHTGRNHASVYELIGPSTGHPDRVNVLSTVDPTVGTAAGRTSETWALPAPRQVTQLSVGNADLGRGSTTAVRLEVETPRGAWQVVAGADRGVGDGPGESPYLLARPDHPLTVIGIRVVVDGTALATGTGATGTGATGTGATGTGATAKISDVAVIGPPPAP